MSLNLKGDDPMDSQKRGTWTNCMSTDAELWNTKRSIHPKKNIFFVICNNIFIDLEIRDTLHDCIFCSVINTQRMPFMFSLSLRRKKRSLDYKGHAEAIRNDILAKQL